MQWYHRLLQRLRRLTATQPAVDDSARRDMTLLAHMMAVTQESECTCEEAYSLMDQYVELKLQGAEVASLMPLIHAHFEMCGCCRDELEALQRILTEGEA